MPLVLGVRLLASLEISLLILGLGAVASPLVCQTIIMIALLAHIYLGSLVLAVLNVAFLVIALQPTTTMKARRIMACFIIIIIIIFIWLISYRRFWPFPEHCLLHNSGVFIIALIYCGWTVLYLLPRRKLTNETSQVTTTQAFVSGMYRDIFLHLA